ncbi:MAG TPA: ABC transporter permease [Candidatus Angelobacter sp.]
MRNLFQDVRYGLRMLGKNPAFTLVAVITLALGIGANTAIFSIADAFLLRPVTFPDTDRLVMVMELSPGQTDDWNTVASGNLEDWKQQSNSFEPLAAGRWSNFNLTGSGDPLRVHGFEVTPNFLDTLRMKPARGRGFLPGEDMPGHDSEVVLGYGLWQRQFGSNEHIVGSIIELNGEAHTVVGVMPKGFSFPPSAELWVPMAMSGRERTSRNNHTLYVVTRLKAGRALPEAQAEMNAVSARLEASYPKTNQGWHVHVIPIATFVTGDLTRSYTLLLLGAVGFVLLIACANVANLQFARSTVREREMAVRLSLGAGRWRVIRQLLAESVVLGLGGAVLGLLLAEWGVKLILAYMPPDVAKYLPGWDTIAIDWRAFMFTLSMAMLAGVISGLAPAAQSAKVDLNEALKEGARSGTTSSSRHRLRSAFVVLQVMLSLVLLVGSGLMVKSVRTLIALNHDFSPSTMLTLHLNLPDTKYKNAQQMSAFYDRMLEEVSTAPGVRSAAIATQLPFAEGGSLNLYTFSIEGRPVSSAQDMHTAVGQWVSPGYLPLMGISLREGRLLSDDDTASTLPVAVISQRLAARYWPNESAVGQHIRLGPEDATGPWMTVAGVVADIQNSWISTQPEPTIYIPYRQSTPSSSAVAVRTEASPSSVISSVRSRVARVDADLPLYEVKSYAEVVHESILGLEYVAVMLSVLGVIALMMAAVGLYGVMSYLVTLRTREIGIRMALGAQRSEVLAMALRWSLPLVGLGMLAGVSGAVLLARLLSSLLYGVRATDIATLLISGAALIAAALLATLIPARRATRVDPMVALRYE